MTNCHYVYPYKVGLQGLAELCRLTNLKRIRRTNSQFKGVRAQSIVNWGCSHGIPNFDGFEGELINKMHNVRNVTNKARYYEILNQFAEEGAPLVPVIFTRDPNVVSNWLANGKTAFARTVLTGASGVGIVDIQTQNDLQTLLNRGYPQDTVFVQYFPKKHEYRVHVVNGTVADVQRKGRPYRLSKDEESWRIRNTKNNWVFVRGTGEVNPPQSVLNAGIEAVRMFGLDFGAVDVLYNQRLDLPLCIEINTAPGLTNTTAYMYAKAFHEAGWLEANEGVLAEAHSRRHEYAAQYPENVGQEEDE